MSKFYARTKSMSVIIQRDSIDDVLKYIGERKEIFPSYETVYVSESGFSGGKAYNCIFKKDGENITKECIEVKIWQQ